MRVKHIVLIPVWLSCDLLYLNRLNPKTNLAVSSIEFCQCISDKSQIGICLGDATTATNPFAFPIINHVSAGYIGGVYDRTPSVKLVCVL